MAHLSLQSITNNHPDFSPHIQSLCSKTIIQPSSVYLNSSFHLQLSQVASASRHVLGINSAEACYASASIHRKFMQLMTVGTVMMLNFHKVHLLFNVKFIGA
jgi:hypothetical protein